MTKALNYPLALLVLFSSFMMSAANANMAPRDVKVELISEYYRNVVCESTVRKVTYRISNRTDDPLSIQHLGIKIGRHDTLPRGLVSLDNKFHNCQALHTNDGDVSTQERKRFKIPAYFSCDLNVIVDPKEVACGEDGFPTTGHVDRFLVIDFHSASVPTSIRKIKFDMTDFGAGDSLAVMGDKICTTSDQGCSVDHVNDVNEDVTSDFCLSDHSGYYTTYTEQGVAATGESSLISGHICAPHKYTDGQPITENAEADVAAALAAFFALSDEGDNANYLEADYFSYSHTPRDITGGFYRFKHNFHRTIFMDTHITVRSGSGKAIFLIDPGTEWGNTPGNYAFVVDDETRFTTQEGSNTDEILFLVNGNVDMDLSSHYNDFPATQPVNDSEYSFVGNLLSTGSIHVANEGHHSSYIRLSTRLLAYDNDVTLLGNYRISKPRLQ